MVMGSLKETSWHYDYDNGRGLFRSSRRFWKEAIIKLKVGQINMGEKVSAMAGTVARAKGLWRESESQSFRVPESRLRHGVSV